MTIAYWVSFGSGLCVLVRAVDEDHAMKLASEDMHFGPTGMRNILSVEPAYDLV